MTNAQTIAAWKIHALFSAECANVDDTNTMADLVSFLTARENGPVHPAMAAVEVAEARVRGENALDVLFRFTAAMTGWRR